MTNSDQHRVARRNVLAWGALLFPLLACGVDGDLASMGCPPGETCTGMGTLSFTRAGAFRCGVLRTLGSWEALDPGTTAVALGGRTQASAWAGLFGPTSFERRFSNHFEALPTPGDARAIRVGPGRFSVYDPSGNLIDYVSLPVVEAATAMVLDDLTCPDQARVLLRGLAFAGRPLVLDAGGRALVDLDATVSAIEDPGGAPGVVRMLVRFGGGREVVDELTEVEAIERIEPVLSPVQLLLDGDALAVQVSWSFCFQAFVDDAVVLGVPVSSAVTDAPDVLEVSPSGQCITLEDLRTEPAPARTAHVTVRMAEATRTFDVRLPALAE